jgi:hypothetical protein
MSIIPVFGSMKQAYHKFKVRQGYNKLKTNLRLCLKTTKGWECSSVDEHRHKALGLTSNTTKKKNGKPCIPIVKSYTYTHGI